MGSMIQDGQLSEQELEVVVGGLARPWVGSWDTDALAGAPPAGVPDAPATAGPDAVTVGEP